MTAVRAEGLSKRYQRIEALSGASFEIAQGSVVGLVGANGAGKTTLMRLLLGLVSPSAGSAEVFGHSIRRPDRFVGRTGSLLESPRFDPGLSARRSLRSLAAASGVSTGRVDRALEAVELTGRADDRFRTYSLGMRQRLGVAAALLHEPELLILDEPTNGLDPDGISGVRRLLGRLRAEGRTVIVSSHQLAQLEQLADHIIVLDRGRVIASCSLVELRRLAVPQVRIEFLDADTELLQQLSAASPAIEVNGPVVHVAGDEAQASRFVGAATAAGATLHRFQREELSLELAVRNLLASSVQGD